MRSLLRCICDALGNGALTGAALALISALSLAMALTAEYGFGLEPCVLCIYQRWPYGLVIVSGLLAALLSRRNKTTAAGGLIALCGLIFTAGAVIAFYHTGVEQQWWESFLSGCQADVNSAATPEELLTAIRESDFVPCDEIPWVDPILGWSMAAHNTYMSAGLAVVAFISAWLILKPGYSSSSVSQ